MKFSTIVSDPPWRMNDKLKMSKVPRGAEANYKTMSISEIKAMPVKDLADPDGAILALWVPSCLLQEGLDVMKTWGFTYKQTYIWSKVKKIPLSVMLKQVSKLKLSDFSLKDYKTKLVSLIKNDDLNNTLSFGLGRLFRQTHEICLIGINNKKFYKYLENKSQRSVSFAFNLKHSAKPEHLQNSLELMFPNNPNRLELFARRQRKNWYCLGNQAPMTEKEDINMSLNKLISISENNILELNNIISCYDDSQKEKLFEIWQ